MIQECNRFAKYSILLSFIFIIISSFDRHEIIYSPITKADKESTNKPSAISMYDDTIAIITNSNNSYDYIGAQHNTGVDNLLPLLDPNSLTKDNDIYTQLSPFVQSLGYDSSAWKTFYSNQVNAGYFPFSILPRLDSLGNSLYANSIVSSYANSYIQRIFDSATTYLDTTSPSAGLYSNFANGLISLEGAISSNDNLSESEKNGLLAVCAVGRYSAAHWENCISTSELCMSKENSQDNIGYIYNYSGMSLSGPNNSIESYVFPNYSSTINNSASNNRVTILQSPKLWPKWLRRVLADVAGGIIGLSGGLVGVIGGAVGGTLLEVIAEHGE